MRESSDAKRDKGGRERERERERAREGEGEKGEETRERSKEGEEAVNCEVEPSQAKEFRAN
jgi:hypothetical protein